MKAVLSNLNEIISKSSDGYAVYLAKMNVKLLEEYSHPDPASAAIAYALGTEDMFEFLSYWNEGEFQILCDNWEDIPDDVFIGADQFLKSSKK